MSGVELSMGGSARGGKHRGNCSGVKCSRTETLIYVLTFWDYILIDMCYPFGNICTPLYTYVHLCVRAFYEIVSHQLFVTPVSFSVTY